MPVHFQNNLVSNSKSYKPNHRRSISQRLKASTHRSPLTLKKLERMNFRSPNKITHRRSLEPPPKSPRRSIIYTPRSPTIPPPPLPKSSISVLPKKSLTRSRRTPNFNGISI